MTAAPLLSCREIGKNFPGVTALADLSLDLEPGQVLGLVGENGAGKSTLLKILAGVYPPSSGRLLWKGEPIAFSGTEAALRAGIVTVHQDINLIGSLSVADNVFLNNVPGGRTFLSPASINAQAKLLLDRYQVPVPPDVLVDELPADLKKMVQIVKALTWSPSVLLLDEPTSSLTEVEVSVVLELVRSLAKSGVAVVFVSHYLNEVRTVSDTVLVLRDGRPVWQRPIADAGVDQMVEAMLGRRLSTERRARAPDIGDRALRFSVEGLTAKGISDISLGVREGEVLGVTGLTGCGTTELARALFGAVPRVSGTTKVGGGEIVLRNPADAIRNGIAFVSSDRGGEGLLLGGTIYDNVALPVLDRLAGFLGRLRGRDLVALGDRGIQRLGIKARSAYSRVSQLSGGNQQKTVFAKWLETEPDILILSEPTVGVDVGSKEEIRAIIETLVSEGKSIVLLTAELTDIERLCDRVLVLFRGRVVHEFFGADIKAETILQAATSGGSMP